MSSPTGNPLSGLPAEMNAVVDHSGKPTTHFKQWMRGVKRVLLPGINLTGANKIVLAKLTGGGTNGSITVVNGIVTQYTAPT